MVNLAHWKGNVKSSLLSNGIVQEVVSQAVIEGFCQESNHDWRRSFWSPRMTVMTFLLQVMDGAKTLRAAVSALLTHMAAQGHEDLPSSEPSAYCQARMRLPFKVLCQSLDHVAAHMGKLVTQATAWHGRRIWIVDGSNASTPDTPKLQREYPQSSSQKPGCGFPAIQFVALFCWSTGAVVDLVMDTMIPHELSLFRRLWHRFQAGDVVLGDRAYGSFVDMSRLLQQGVFGVFRLHQRRKADFRQGKKLGHDDCLQTWQKPQRRLSSMGITEQQFEALPQTLSVRLIRITKAPRGFRSRTIVVATTLIDPIAYPAEDIRALYRDRWTVEINLRSLKTHMGMEVLRGLSPDVVRKEIIMHLLAYNLIRLLMWQAARQHGRDRHRLSFTGTLHRLRTSLPLLWFYNCGPGMDIVLLYQHLLHAIANDRVPHRPDRVEPRRVKRRPKTYSRLVHPRSWYHQRRDSGAR
jgi:hypothetical protein